MKKFILSFFLISISFILIFSVYFLTLFKTHLHSFLNYFGHVSPVSFYIDKMDIDFQKRSAFLTQSEISKKSLKINLEEARFIFIPKKLLKRKIFIQNGEIKNIYINHVVKNIYTDLEKKSPFQKKDKLNALVKKHELGIQKIRNQWDQRLKRISFRNKDLKMIHQAFKGESLNYLKLIQSMSQVKLLIRQKKLNFEKQRKILERDLLRIKKIKKRLKNQRKKDFLKFRKNFNQKLRTTFKLNLKKYFDFFFKYFFVEKLRIISETSEGTIHGNLFNHLRQSYHLMMKGKLLSIDSILIYKHQFLKIYLKKSKVLFSIRGFMNEKGAKGSMLLRIQAKDIKVHSLKNKFLIKKIKRELLFKKGIDIRILFHGPFDDLNFKIISPLTKRVDQIIKKHSFSVIKEQASFPHEKNLQDQIFKLGESLKSIKRLMK